jgi:hypothetical protein
MAEIAKFNERESLKQVVMTVVIEASPLHRIAFWLGVQLIKAGCWLAGIGFRCEGGAGGDA